MPITNVHDKFIRQILSNKELAIDFLREFLPETLVNHMDLQTLEHQDTSYINEELKESFSDLIWRVNMKGKESLRISLLLEHKSYADPKVVFQLLEYLACGYRKQIREKQKPELIIPILYYHGKNNWKFRSLESYFAHYPDFMKKYLPWFEPEFVNLHKLAPEQILTLQNGLLSSAVMLQKYSFDPAGLATHIHSILENLSPYLESNATNAIFVYMIHGTQLDERHFTESVQKLPEHMSTKAMTLYDQIISKRKDQWIEEGMEKGIEQGITQSLQTTILNAFDNGVEIPLICLITGEAEEKIYTVLRQNERIS